ncbi:hypothetical protein EV356DRAFT_567662 [Viridothelium virens]|uniref:Ubiquitin-domain-containing protein n=1 Tax=Viridothelium virens TaxID=1048519 RepID=A0A6A6H6X2_VIRVR|nr:hypothetical protein EV356DRAFT_567662 [Viridothelium virens]
MADEGTSSGDEVQVTFNVRTSSEAKYTLSLPVSTKISAVKEKLATSDYADTPPDRQRLIYSGRVMKDGDTLSTYKVKDGNTVHLVKSAASNARQNPANQPSNSSARASPTNTGGAPSNIASGPGTSPLNNLTGARFAGYGPGLPGMDMFGPDGGMAGGGNFGEEMLRQMDNPMVLSQINEAMNNPDFLRMMRESPLVRDNPMMREFIGTPAFRSMMTNPDMLRAQLRMQQAMTGGQQNAFPAPGVTDTTPQGAAATQQGEQGQQGRQAQNQQNPLAGLGMGMGMNPFAMGGMGGGNPFATGNPFAQLFPQQAQNQTQPSANTSSATSPPPPASADGEATATSTTNTGIPRDDTSTQEGQNTQQQQQTPNPFGNLFGAAGGQGGASPFNNIMQQMMQNPEAMQQMMNFTRSMYGQGQGEGQGGNESSSDPASNPFAALEGLAGLGNRFGAFGGMGGAGGAQQTPQDTRPPEEQYVEQLRQLNEMGFHEFERNVRALRMAGGSVQGAVEMLLSGTV